MKKWAVPQSDTFVSPVVLRSSHRQVPPGCGGGGAVGTNSPPHCCGVGATERAQLRHIHKVQRASEAPSDNGVSSRDPANNGPHGGAQTTTWRDRETLLPSPPLCRRLTQTIVHQRGRGQGVAR